MADAKRYEKGLEILSKVYAGDVVTPPRGTAFTDIMLETLFAEVWTRDVLSMRDRRLLLLGSILTQGENMTFGIQARAALKNGELTAEELREVLVFLVHYVGYPRAASVNMQLEQVIADFQAEDNED